MTTYSLTDIANAPVPARAMTAALSLAPRPCDDLQTLLRRIAHEYGGNELTAHAIALRLKLLAMLLAIDPAITLVTAKLNLDQIGTVVAAHPVSVTERGFDFDADALATALRFAAEPLSLA